MILKGKAHGIKKTENKRQKTEVKEVWEDKRQ